MSAVSVQKKEKTPLATKVEVKVAVPLEPHNDGREHQNAPNAGLQEEPPIVPPWANVMVYPRARLLVDDIACGIWFKGNQVDIPPCTDHKCNDDACNKCRIFTLEFGRVVPENSDYEWQKQCIDRHRAFAHERESKQQSTKNKMFCGCLPFIHGAVYVVDCPHHKGVAEDVPCCRACM